MKKIKIDLTHLKRLGIDEIALKKGQGQYIIILVNLDTNKPIAFAKSRKHSDIRKVPESWGIEVLDQINEVSMDMSGNYKGIVTELLPNAIISVDRFHVMKMVNQELDAAQKYLKKAAESLSDATVKAQLKAPLHHSKYVLLKPRNDLTPEQQSQLEALRQVAPCLVRMHALKEEFREIFASSDNWADGTLRLLDWLASAADFKESVGTITRWFSEIVGYFEQGTTNGVIEGINNKLKLIKRSGYSFRNFENFQLRCFICWYLNDALA